MLDISWIKERERGIHSYYQQQSGLPDVGISDMDFDALPQDAGQNIAKDLLKSMYAKAENDKWKNLPSRARLKDHKQ